MVLQLLAVLVPLACSWRTGDSDLFFYAYFSVGGVQLASCIINFYVLDPFLKHPLRRPYEVALLALVILSLLALADINAVADVFFPLVVFGSPCMAIYYFVTSIAETRLVAANVKRKQYVLW